MLVNPAGIVKAGPVVGEEALLTAEFHRDERRATKAYFDAVGHYTRWDAIRLDASDDVYEPFAPRREAPARDAKASSDRALSDAEVESLAAEHDISFEAVQAVARAVRRD
jgi:amidase/nitrilase